MDNNILGLRERTVPGRRVSFYSSEPGESNNLARRERRKSFSTIPYNLT